MIEIKNRFHTQRLFADKLPLSDLWKAVYYAGYRGDRSSIPFYYKIINGETAITDLRQTPEELLSRMKSNTRNEIRRAEREGIEFSKNVSYEEFVPLYNEFSLLKGLNDKCSIERLAKYNKTIITKASYNGQTLAMHANVINKESKFAFLLFSCSPRLDDSVDKKMIGWGNRFLHFKELEYFKLEGIETYDWSGVCTDENDERYSISSFKLSFGGEVRESLVIESPLYVFLSFLRDLYWKGKKLFQ